MTTSAPDRYVQLFVPTFQIEECLAEIRECLESGWTGLGNKTIAFEEAWKSYTGHAHAHFLNSATAGLFCAIHIFKQASDWSDGDEVISTPLTFVSTAHAITAARLRLVLADVDETGCLDPESIASRITPRTRAVVFVGFGGEAGRYRAVERLCRERGLRLILDAAHMAGTWLNGVAPGLDADATAYSFQAVKNLPTGDAGIICFKDAALDRAARRLSWLGIDKDTYTRFSGAYSWHYDVTGLGYKLHGNSIMAAIALVQLRYLERDNARRREIAGWYDALLDGVPDIQRVTGLPDCLSSRHLYQVRVGRRDRVVGILQSRNIFPGVHYRSINEFSFYAGATAAADAAAPCPAARAFSDSALSLPLHLRLERPDVNHVCASLRDAVASCTAG